MSTHIPEALIIIKHSIEYRALLYAVNNGSIRIVYSNGHGIVDGSLSAYLYCLINNSKMVYMYKVLKDAKELPQGELPKEIQDCLNIPELIPILLKHKLGISE